MKAMGNLMRQAQQMQENMQAAQAAIAELKVEGQATGVRLTLSGKHELLDVVIDEAAMEDKELLADMLMAAHRNALATLTAQSEAKMAGVRKGLPPGLKLPF